MQTHEILTFNVTLLFAVASPGPALLYALKTALSQGFFAALVSGCGLALMAATWTLMALLGLDGLFKSFPLVYAIFKIAGAVYLAYIAWNMWRCAANKPTDTADPPRRLFMGGIMLNLMNPKSVLFAAAVLVVIFPAGMSMTEKAIVFTNHLVLEVMFYTAFAKLMTTRSITRRYLQAKPAIDRAAALVLGALGLRLLLDR